MEGWCTPTLRGILYNISTTRKARTTGNTREQEGPKSLSRKDGLILVYSPEPPMHLSQTEVEESESRWGRSLKSGRNRTARIFKPFHAEREPLRRADDPRPT